MLRVGNNEIGDDGAKSIAESLKDNESLATLDISSSLFSRSKIGNEGAKALAQALQKNSTLAVLSLGD